MTDDVSVTLSSTGSTRGREHAWLLGRFRQHVVGPGEPLRTPYGLSVSPWEWLALRLAATGDPGCTNEGAEAPCDDIPALVEPTAAPAPLEEILVWADGAAAEAGDPGQPGVGTPLTRLTRRRGGASEQGEDFVQGRPRPAKGGRQHQPT